ncbi:MAG TPA: iron-containing alcohol dehydrogenase [Rhodopila sp.]|uniref:iron-containing alcohol dehydrogenase n=1 Tax=Rhodopila sp. TaxID=2480087 RepID=UPI002D0F461B|nr:iron-containing alcohol dehydrogenase [Rhodopila sp.]HVY17949.1 iron-containing alcohol dehydrogenase [Rhodopila sp.]
MTRGIHRYPPMERVIYGIPLAEALAEEIARLDAKAVYVMASGTLNRTTDVVQSVRDVLGNRMAGLCDKIASHTPRIDVVKAANEARAAKADLVLTVGGGSVTDAAKMVGICLGNDISEPEQLDTLKAVITPEGKTRRPPTKAPTVRSVDVPTTLSAGEFTAMAGCTDTVRNIKESYAHPLMMPQTVILDPAVAVHTPEWLFLSTGIRAVDHAVEDLCSINPTPFSDGMSLQALRLLSSGLPAVKNDPADLDARLNCQLGAWMSIMGSQNGVTKGASHGIGHVLGGTAHVPHGYTSCVMLPHVLRFNEPVNAERQRWVAEALGKPDGSAADAVAALIAGLGLPGTLRDVGVKPDQLDEIAVNSMHDRWVHTNPRKIEGPATVRMLLDAAW